MRKILVSLALVFVMILSVAPTALLASQATAHVWSWDDVIVRVNGEIVDIRATGSSSRLELPVVSVLYALNLPSDYVEWPTSHIRQHVLAELLNIDIVFDMYYRTVDITSGPQSEGLSRVLPVQYIPRYGWVRMTNDMLREIERMMGEEVARQIEAETLRTIVFCPYLSAGNRRFAYEISNNRHLPLFTHSHRAPTGSNYLARMFFGSLYRPGLVADTGAMPVGATILNINMFSGAEDGTIFPGWRSVISDNHIEVMSQLVEMGVDLEDARATFRENNPRVFSYVGVGRHFCERTGNLYSGSIQFGNYGWLRHTRGQIVNGVRVVEEEFYITGLYTFHEDGYVLRYRDWHGERVLHSRTRISPDSPRYQTGCPFINGFETLELMMLESAFNGER